MLGKLINFQKQLMIGKTIKEIQLFQNPPYSLEDVEWIQTILQNELNVLDEEKRYAVSLKIEPRAPVPPAAGSGSPAGSRASVGSGGSGNRPASMATTPGTFDAIFGEMELPPGYPFVEPDSERNLRTQ